MIYSTAWRSNPIIANISRLKGGGDCAPRLPEFDFISFDPIPSAGLTHSFLESCMERANDIKLLDRDLMVLFSGGVDCTVATISMIHAGIGHKTTIGMSKTGWLNTDPELIQYFVDSGCKIVDINGKSLKDYVDNGGHYITGCQGDTILNSDYIHRRGIIDDLWEIGIEDMFNRLSGLNNSMKLVEHCSVLFNAMPDHLERNAPNMVWWLEFCGDWHINNFNVTSRVNTGIPGITHTHFFDSIPFQRWSQQDYTQKVGRTKETHKQVMYDVCYVLSGRRFKLPVKTEGWGDIFVDNYDPSYRSRLLAIHNDWREVHLTW